MTGHNARVVGGPGRNGKWAWDCAQCGDYSGCRYTTEDRAAIGAIKHNANAADEDQQRYLRMFGPRTVEDR